MAEAGAGYVIFTVMQVSRFMIAPNAAFDRISGYPPGEACAARDLVDLVDTIKMKRVKVSFGTGYATHFEIRVSVEGKKWQTVAAKEDHDGQPFEAALEAAEARYVRVCGIKPDGENQKGNQMSVAELEVYE